jgi:hypothetical protein
MNLDEILTEWEKDSQIDTTKLEASSTATPMLHAKYLRMYTMAKIRMRQIELDRDKMAKDKWLYYSGKMDIHRIEELGWEPDPFEGLRVLKGDLEQYYKADNDLQEFEKKITYYRQLIECLKEILDQIRWRSNTIRNIIELRKFENGVY